MIVSMAMLASRTVASGMARPLVLLLVPAAGVVGQDVEGAIIITGDEPQTHRQLQASPGARGDPSTSICAAAAAFFSGGVVVDAGRRSRMG